MSETNRSKKAKLKAERIQDTLTVAELAGAPFTPDRIEVLLRGLPGWRRTQNQRGIWRLFQFGAADAAVAFVGLVSMSGEAAGRPVLVEVNGAKVACRLGGQGGKPITFDDVKLAMRISLQG
jgi:pterin-4a-carbinolamine dehydratase